MQQRSLACPSQQFFSNAFQFDVSAQELEQLVSDSVSSETEAATLEFETNPDFRNFRICRMSGAHRPVEAMIWMLLSSRREEQSPERSCRQTSRLSEIASGLKKIINGDFKRRVFIGEEAERKDRRFLTGRQVAWMICEHVKVSDKGDSALDRNPLFQGEIEERPRAVVRHAIR